MVEQCFVCECSFVDKQCLFDHIKNVHKTSTSFKCIFENYNQLYANFHSFHEHIAKKHARITDEEMRRMRYLCRVAGLPSLLCDLGEVLNSEKIKL